MREFAEASSSRPSRPARSSHSPSSVLDVALATGERRRRWLRPYGGVLQSGDLEIAVDSRHLRISKQQQTVVQLPLELISGLAFRTADDGTASELVALTPAKPPRHLLDAAVLTPAEWDLAAEMIAEATAGRLVLKLLR